MAGLPSIFPLVWRIVSFFVSAFGASRIRLAEALHESSGFREIILSAVPT
jgi:hypothetical protein